MSQTLLRPGLFVLSVGVALGGYASPDSGVSDEASSIHESFETFIHHQESSESLFGDKARLISALRELAAECLEENWDGYDGRAVSEAVVLRAEAFIRALPEDVPAPELAPEPDGQISFDWLPSRTRTFTLSVNAGNRLAYAWIDGFSKGHGVELFDGRALPARALEELRRMSRDDATLRST